jgi:hypothetical protein
MSKVHDMSVAIFLPNLGIGGAERVSIHLARELTHVSSTSTCWAG